MEQEASVHGLLNKPEREREREKRSGGTRLLLSPLDSQQSALPLGFLQQLPVSSSSLAPLSLQTSLSDFSNTELHKKRPLSSPMLRHQLPQLTFQPPLPAQPCEDSAALLSNLSTNCSNSGPGATLSLGLAGPHSASSLNPCSGPVPMDLSCSLARSFGSKNAAASSKLGSKQQQRSGRVFFSSVDSYWGLQPCTQSFQSA